MANLKQFRLPDLGEGLTEGEILKWLVAPGETVKLNQPIVEVETAKAAVEVPSPYAGLVTELHHGEGETVDVGSPIITFDTEPGATPTGTAQRAAESQAAGAAANPAESASAAFDAGQSTAVESELMPVSLVEHPPDDAAVEPGLIGGPAPGGRTSVLVGYGPKSVTAKRRPRKSDNGAGAPAPANSALVRAPAAPQPPISIAPPPRTGSGVAVLAKPPVRKLARDRGIDLASVTGTGPAGTITRADVEAADAPESANQLLSAAGPAFDPATREERIPVKGVRKRTAAAMVSSAFTAPHVTEFLTLDVTATMDLVRRLRTLPDFADVKVSPLLLVAKALLLGVRRHPMINSAWDEAAQEIVVKDYVNLGIAAATPRGLIVPNIKDAGRLSLVELARELQVLTEVARAGRTTPADMAGGTITITNVGIFGVDTGTPILNPGEAAILALGVIRATPWVHEGEIVVRQVTTLGLSFDHRIVDGALGSQFLADVGALLADPAQFLAWS